MIRRPCTEERSAGFSLVELLVVITILGILAGIAIPVFLRHRAKGYVATLESVLRNAATSSEGWATEHDGAYVAPGPDAITELMSEGLTLSSGVTLTVVDDHMTATNGGFCLRAVHTRLGAAEARYFASSGPASGKPTTVPCVAS